MTDPFSGPSLFDALATALKRAAMRWNGGPGTAGRRECPSPSLPSPPGVWAAGVLGLHFLGHLASRCLSGKPGGDGIITVERVNHRGRLMEEHGSCRLAAEPGTASVALDGPGSDGPTLILGVVLLTSAKESPIDSCRFARPTKVTCGGSRV